MRRIFRGLINYAAPRNEHVGIIFRVNCSKARFFTIEFLYFQVHYLCKREFVLNLTKEQAEKLTK